MFLKLAGVRVRVQLCTRGRRYLAKVWVVYWRCLVGDCIRRSGDCWGLQLKGGTEGQDVVTGLGGIVVDNRLEIHDKVVLLYIL